MKRYMSILQEFLKPLEEKMIHSHMELQHELDLHFEMELVYVLSSMGETMSLLMI